MTLFSVVNGIVMTVTLLGGCVTLRDVQGPFKGCYAATLFISESTQCTH